MNQQVIDEAVKFVLYLENVDGPSWNSLMRELSSIHQANFGYCYFGLGMEPCLQFVDKWFGQYWYSFCPQELKYDFRLYQNTVILFAAAEILAGAEKEFKIGNYFN
jgi:hypothetical protein